MEAPRIRPEPPAAPLRLLEGRSAAAPDSFPSLRAWILLFGALSFSGGHGVFLLVALTRLRAIPSRVELGHGLEPLVIGWFVAAVPLAFASAGLRRRFLRLGAGASWSLAGGVLALTLLAFGTYLRAVALAG